MAKRNTRSWKHNGIHSRKAWGTAKANKRNTPFMSEDMDMEMWESEMQYHNTDDGIEEE